MISNKGFMEGIISLKMENEGTIGAPISMTENNTVASSLENDKFIGVLKNQRGTLAAVQVKGFATVKLSGEIALGISSVVADGEGGIKAGTGREVMVLSIDEEAATADIIM